MKIVTNDIPNGLKNTTLVKKQMVLNALNYLNAHNYSDPTHWPTTRDIANACDDSIFVIRYWLGLLEKDGAIVSITTNGNSGGRGNPLRWSLKCAERNTDSALNIWKKSNAKW